MQAVLTQWIADLRRQQIPVHYLQLDDWFYQTQDRDIRCIYNFSAARKSGKMTSGIFPSGQYPWLYA